MSMKEEKTEKPLDRDKLSAVNKSFSNKVIQDAIKDEEKSKKSGTFLYFLIFLIAIGAVTYVSIRSFKSKSTSSTSNSISSSTSTEDPTVNSSLGITEIDCTSYKKVNVPDDYSTIQEAIDNSGMETEIIIAQGTYNENLTVLGALCLTGEGEVTVKGSDTLKPTITILGGNTKISGLTIRSDAQEADFDVWQKAGCIFVDREDAMVNIMDNFFINCNIAIAAINQSRLYIKDNVITAENNKYGIALTYSEVKTQGNSVSGARYGEYYYGCTGEVANDTITGGYYGISTYSTSQLSIHNNDLKDVQYAGINYAKDGSDDIKDNQFENVPNELFANETGE